MPRRKDFYPVLIFYFEYKVKDFSKRIQLYFLNAWFERNQWPKMVILVKIVKIGQLQMGVESWEPTNDSGFFHLKHSDTIAEQKKIHIEDFRRGLSFKKNPKWS
jgi:hypothetical protein